MVKEGNNLKDIAEVMATRTLSDAEKIKGGAHFVMDENADKPRLEFTEEQIEEAREEMGEYFEVQKEKERRKVSEPTPREIMIKTLTNFQTVFDDSVLEVLEKKFQSYQNVRAPKALAYVIARNHAFDQFRKKEVDVKKQERVAANLLAEEQEKKERREFEVAKQEFWDTANEIIRNSTRLQRGKEMMALLYSWVFEGTRDVDFPRDTPEAYREYTLRAQYRHRAMVHLSNSNFASALLKKVIWNPQYRKYGRT
jgi:hypothetical protein